jgi:hypothetical protein
MRIGLDLDNTIIDYGAAIYDVAVESGLVDSAAVVARSKEAVKAYLTGQDQGEERWMRLQGQIYGTQLGRAIPYEGVADFLDRARARGWTLFIVSHKTRLGHFDPTGTDLRAAALAWLAKHGFAAPGAAPVPLANVFFETTKGDKIARIAALKLGYYVDDLAEILTSAQFPPETVGIHFAPTGARGADSLPSFRAWRELLPLLDRLEGTAGAVSHGDRRSI